MSKIWTFGEARTGHPRQRKQLEYRCTSGKVCSTHMQSKGDQWDEGKKRGVRMSIKMVIRGHTILEP